MSSALPLKVCLFSGDLVRRGGRTGSYTADLLEHLPSSRCEVTLVCPPGRRLPAGDYRHVPLPVAALGGSPRGWVGRARAFGDLLRRGRILDPSHFDLLHFADAREALWLPGGMPPAVGTVRNLVAGEERRSVGLVGRVVPGAGRRGLAELTRSLERRAFGRVRRLITDTHYLRRTVSRRFELPVHAIEVVEVGISPPRELKDAPPLLDGDPSILFNASDGCRAGLLSLARAVAMLSRRELPHVQVHVLGEDHESQDLFVSLQLLGVWDRFHFHGEVDRERARSFYSRAEITCVPSPGDAYRLAYLESMMAGTPVIAGHGGGTVEFIQHGSNGLLVDPDEPADIARCIIELCDNRDLRLHLVSKARATAARFGAERMARGTLEVYRKLVGENEPPRSVRVWSGLDGPVGAPG